MTPYWIFIIFLFSFGLPTITFAQPVDVEIDWIIEGQAPIVKSEVSTESNIKNDSIIEEQINNFLSPQNENL